MYSFTVGVPSEDFRKALGDDANYAFGMTAWLPNPSLKDQWFGAAQQLTAAYTAKSDYAPDYHAAYGVRDDETIVKAIEQADSLHKTETRDGGARWCST